MNPGVGALWRTSNDARCVNLAEDIRAWRGSTIIRTGESNEAMRGSLVEDVQRHRVWEPGRGQTVVRPRTSMKNIGAGKVLALAHDLPRSGAYTDFVLEPTRSKTRAEVTVARNKYPSPTLRSPEPVVRP